MTPEERQMLAQLVTRIKSAPTQDHDPEADQEIRGLTLARPDATYILTQTVLMQDFALRNAQAQIADLQRQLQTAQSQPRASGSFLGGLFGGAQPQPQAAPTAGPWGQAQPQPAAYASPAYAPVVMQPSQTSGFLRSAATTAAGIAGGALLFEGIQSLFSHPGYGGFVEPMGMGGGWGGGGFGPRESVSETIINNNTTTNYYDDQGRGADPVQTSDYQPDPNFNPDRIDSNFDDVGTGTGGDLASNDFGSDSSSDFS